MPRPRLQKTLADYLAIAVTPALIMLLVGSLVFFLQSLFYEGQHGSRVLWILFWFVIGAVLVARIAMQSGRGYAAVFTLALAGATSLAMFRFADAPLVPIVCLGIIWWCTDKLTWDCTLIDDSEDASGEGLLQVAGVADEAEFTEEQSRESSENSRIAPDESPRASAPPLWKRLFLNESERAGKPHAPGLWVVYFSLAALPLFGLGQFMLPPGDAVRQFAFRCLVVYVASGLGLLMLTSFLGLRRYLRQRNLQMPVSMALTWIGMGSAIAIGILCVCLVLPRPEGEYNVTALVEHAGDRIQQAADRAFLDDSSGEGEGQRSGDADESARQGAASDSRKHGEPGGTDGQQAETSDNATDDENGTQQGGEQDGGQGREGEQQATDAQQKDGQSGETADTGSDAEANGETDSATQEPSGQAETPEDSAENNAEAGTEQQTANTGDSAEDSSESASNADNGTPPSPDAGGLFSQIGRIFQWIVYAVAVLAALYLILRNRSACSAFLAKLWSEFLSLFGRRPAAAASLTPDHETTPEPQRPFAEFSNPFASGTARGQSPSELVRYTFEALQAWGVENGCPRDLHQTPDEFGQQLRRHRTVCAVEGQAVSQLYARIAYTGHRPGEETLPILETLWRKME